MTIRNVIIDTDFCTDVGDFGGVCCALTAHRLGLIQILGFVVSASYTNSPIALDATRKWWGLPQLPLGQWAGTPIDNSPGSSANWANRVAGFSHDISGTPPSSITVYRTLLAAQTAPVDIVSMGYLNNLSALLDSSADGISSLTGSQLLQAKVRTIWVMAGQYPSGPSEWNMRGGAVARSDICTDSNNIATNCPVPVRWLGYELGTANSGGTFGRTSADIVGAAYQDDTSGRPFWDELPNIAAIWEGADFQLVHGSQTVNTTTGVNTWTDNFAAKDAYLVKTVPDTWFTARMNLFISANPQNSPILASWGSAPSILRINAVKAAL